MSNIKATNDKAVGDNISVLILAQNSEETIERTLESVRCFEDVLVVDGGSKDKTESIVKRYPNTRFVRNPFKGFSDQRNFSIKEAKGAWCFEVDSDECVTPELATQLKKIAMSQTEKWLYKIVRTEYLNQEEISQGFGSSTYQERFFRRDNVEYRGEIHESPFKNGKSSQDIPNLVGHVGKEFRLLHNPDVSVSDTIRKIAFYSILKGKEKVRLKRTSNPLLVFLNFNWTFFRIFLKSYKQGRRGFMISIVDAVHRCLVHLLVYEATVLRSEGKKKTRS